MRTIKRKKNYFVFIIVLLTSIILLTGCCIFGPDLEETNIYQVDMPSQIKAGEQLVIGITLIYSYTGKYKYHSSDIEKDGNKIKITPKVEIITKVAAAALDYESFEVKIDDLNIGKYDIEIIGSDTTVNKKLEVI